MVSAGGEGMNFASFKNARIVRSTWLDDGGRRLDCNPYMSGALEARDKLRNLNARKDPLQAIVAGHSGGIYNGPMFKRNYVDSPEWGVPFISSGTMRLADLTTLPLLRRKDAESTRLSYLRLRQGSTLISCSGTIGRMCYVRPDMDGIWSSQDVLKVDPDASRVPSGYLYAFLSSRYGVPLVVSGTYGAIIQHIEPEHIADLPVPRFSKAKESEIAGLVDAAAKARSEAVHLLKQAEARLYDLLDLSPPTPVYALPKPDVTIGLNSQAQDRCDGYYYSVRNREARSAFDKAANNQPIGSIAEVFIPGIFKRLYASDPQFGSPYITGGDVFELEPTSEKYLISKVASEYRLLLRKGMIVVQEAGQLGGLIGRSVMVGEHLDGFSCSNNMIRIVPKNDVDGGYLFVLLNSEYGVRLLSREAAGSSIPHTDEQRVKRISIPWPEKEVRTKVSELAIKARRLRDRACISEAQARTEVEMLVERGK